MTKVSGKETRAQLSALVDAARSAGEKMSAAVEGLRGRIAELNREKRALESAWVDFETAAERLVRYVDAHADLAAKKAPRVSVFASPSYGSMHADEKSHWDRTELLFCMLAPQLKEAMLAELKAQYDTRPGLAEAERAARLADVERELLDLEMSEESCIRAASRAGFEILRRKNMSPEAAMAADDDLP